MLQIKIQDTSLLVNQAHSTGCMRVDPASSRKAAANELTPDELAEIETAAAPFAVQGARYPEEPDRLSCLWQLSSH